MPKRPTTRVCAAERKLRVLLEDTSIRSNSALPTVRKLGTTLGVNYSTISRLLRRLAAQGLVWQHPNGRFFPVHAAPSAAAGLPVVFLGRQIQHWSGLYQEILEGVSETCAENGYPLMFLSSDKLVRHKSPEMPPSFASLDTQRAELQRLATSIPRLCAGLLFDHLWEEELIFSTLLPSAPAFLLARPSKRNDVFAIAPDFNAGAHLILLHLKQHGYKRIHLAIPFSGDQAVDATGNALQAAASEIHPVRKIGSLDCSTPAKRREAVALLMRETTPTAIVCTEDNVASHFWRELVNAGLENSPYIKLISIQGSGSVSPPITRLRYDYRRLGREAVTAAIERHRCDRLLPPRLLFAKPQTISAPRN